METVDAHMAHTDRRSLGKGLGLFPRLSTGPWPSTERWDALPFSGEAPENALLSELLLFSPGDRA